MIICLVQMKATKKKVRVHFLNHGHCRAGIVYCNINWPQDFYAVLNGKQTTYDYLSALWVLYFIRKYQVKHALLLWQRPSDVIELSLSITNKAHQVVFHEIEKRIFDWQS